MKALRLSIYSLRNQGLTYVIIRDGGVVRIDWKYACEGRRPLIDKEAHAIHGRYRSGIEEWFCLRWVPEPGRRKYRHADFILRRSAEMRPRKSNSVHSGAFFL